MRMMKHDVKRLLGNMRHGSALTSVLMLIFIMTIVGSALLSLVVCNYKMRSLDTNINVAEYENDAVLDAVYKIIQDSLTEAINNASDNTISTVEKDVLWQSYLSDEYENEKEKLKAEWENRTIWGEIKSRDSYVKYHLQNNKESGYNKQKDLYKKDMPDTKIFTYVNKAGIVDRSKIQDEYIEEFKRDFKEEFESSIYKNGVKSTNYEKLRDNMFGEGNANIIKTVFALEEGNGVVTVEITGKEEKVGDYLNFKISPVFNARTRKFDIKLDVSYKTGETPAVSLRTNIIVSTPDFTTVAKLSQEKVVLNDSILNNVLVANQIVINSGKTVIEGNAAAGNITVNGELESTGNLATTGSFANRGSATTNTLYCRGITNYGSLILKNDVYNNGNLNSNGNIEQTQEYLGSYYGFNGGNADIKQNSNKIQLGYLYLDGRIGSIINYNDVLVTRDGDLELIKYLKNIIEINSTPIKTNFDKLFNSHTNWIDGFIENVADTTLPIDGVILTGDNINIEDGREANVVIAKGNITVGSGEFNGIMIAGGTITIDGNFTAKSNPGVAKYIILRKMDNIEGIFNGVSGVVKNYLVTKPSVGYVDESRLITISEWEKTDWGRI